MKLTVRNAKRVQYREFCKYLSKRTVRTFKNAGSKSNEKGAAIGVPVEIERPLRKEASLTYILRKSFELGIDLRKKFNEFDKINRSLQ